MHAQALTLAVLSGAAAYHYYEKRVEENAKLTKMVKWKCDSGYRCWLPSIPLRGLEKRVGFFPTILIVLCILN